MRLAPFKLRNNIIDIYHFQFLLSIICLVILQPATDKLESPDKLKPEHITVLCSGFNLSVDFNLSVVGEF